MKTVTVKKTEGKPESSEIMAAAVVKISDGFAKLSGSGLNRRAIAVLVHDKTKIAMRDIEAVLDALPRLRGWYCR